MVPERREVKDVARSDYHLLRVQLECTEAESIRTVEVDLALAVPEVGARVQGE